MEQPIEKQPQHNLKWLGYVICFVLCSAVTLVMLGTAGTFTKTDSEAIYFDLCNAFSVPGIIMTCFGALVFATNNGAFDMLAFSVIKLFDLFRKDLTKVKYRTFYDYHSAQQGKKRSFAYMIFVGLFFVAVSVVFLLLNLGVL